MGQTLYVGNLPWTTTEEELQRTFAEHGQVESARVIRDRETGRSRGFGFVEVDEADSDRVIAALNGSMVGGREIVVNVAQPRVH